MIGTRLLAYPYQFARTPLAVLQVSVVRRLPEDSLLRRSFDQAFGLLDSTAGRLFGDTSLQRQGAERVRRPAPPAEDAEQASPEPAGRQTTRKSAPRSAAQRARTKAMKAEEHADARPNQSIKTIQRRLEQTEAVAEVRNRRTQQHDDEAGDPS